MSYCSNCGTKLSGGLCPYCNEEALIYEQNLGNDELIGFSDDFMEKVKHDYKEKRKREVSSKEN